MIKILNLLFIFTIFYSPTGNADIAVEPFKNSEIHKSACYDKLEDFKKVISRNEDKILEIYNKSSFGFGHTIFTASIICNNFEVSSFLTDYESLINLMALDKYPVFYLISESQSYHYKKTEDILDKKNNLLTKLIKRGATLKIKEKIQPYEFKDDENSLAKLAAKFGNGKTLEILSNNGINLKKEKTDDGLTILHIAAAHANHRVIDYLLEVGMDINEDNNINKWSPLWSAVNPIYMPSDNSSLRTIDKLIANGANIEHEALYFKHLPIYLADQCFSKNTYKTLKHLLENYRDKLQKSYEFFESPILYAGLRPYPNCAKVVQLLFDSGFDIKEDRHLFDVNAIIGRGDPKVLEAVLRNITLSKINLKHAKNIALKKNRKDMLEILEKY